MKRFHVDVCKFAGKQAYVKEGGAHTVSEKLRQYRRHDWLSVHWWSSSALIININNDVNDVYACKLVVIAISAIWYLSILWRTDYSYSLSAYANISLYLYEYAHICSVSTIHMHILIYWNISISKLSSHIQKPKINNIIVKVDTSLSLDCIRLI